MEEKTQKNRFLELDSLRGIASLLVVLFHCTMYRPEAQYGFKLGVMGVDLFFVISGFVIFMSINNVANGKEFVINRVSRLYPTYWAAVLFSFLLKNLYVMLFPIYQYAKVGPLQLAGNLTMFQHYLRIPDIEDPYWTMIIEMLFYIGILFLFHYKKLKHLTAIGIVLSFAIVILSFTFKDAYIFKKALLIIPLWQYIPLFLAGTLFYKIYFKLENRLKNYVILVFCYISQVLLFSNTVKYELFITNAEYALTLAVFFLLFVLFVNGKLKFLINPISLYFGKISFALYLTHQFLNFNFLLPQLVEGIHWNFWAATLLVTLPISILIATAITYFIEIPYSKKMKNYLKAKFL